MESKFLNFNTTPTQKFVKIWFWITDFTASLLWAIEMTHMHYLLWIYIFMIEYVVIMIQKKFQLWWVISMSHNICPKMSLFKFVTSSTKYPTFQFSNSKIFENQRDRGTKIPFQTNLSALNTISTTIFVIGKFLTFPHKSFWVPL